MRLLFIRHGDPDYENDTLTEKGMREARLLAETAMDLNLGDCFVSPLGRARDTASFSLNKTGKTATTQDWLEEFPSTLDINGCAELLEAFPDTRIEGDKYAIRIPWDVVPGYWTTRPEYFDNKKWRDSLIAKHSLIVKDYDRVTAAFDQLLSSYGCVREGDHYRIETECDKTLTFFCHFGITSVLLSHLWDVSPFILWHCLALAPSSVTELFTEERQKGTAYFRATRIGDQSHLYMGKEEPSFACRFCETFSNTDQRH